MAEDDAAPPTGLTRVLNSGIARGEDLLYALVSVLLVGGAAIVERHLVAEPFLLVGIIASIKEIVVTGVLAGEDADVGDTMLEIGVLGAVVLALSVASLLLRRKEREPSE